MVMANERHFYHLFVTAYRLYYSNEDMAHKEKANGLIYKSLFAENTVASKEKKAQQRKHKYNSNKVHDSR